MPDLTLLFDLEPAAGMARIGTPARCVRAHGLGFHKRVREGYLEIARAENRRVVVLDAGQDVAALQTAVSAAVEELLARRGSVMATDAFAGIRGQDEAVVVLRRAVAGGRVAQLRTVRRAGRSGRKATASPSPRRWWRRVMPVGPGASTAAHVRMCG